ncbi:MBL fold metallo-hydrolase [Sphingobium boeckii]|uniref:Glyoxylase-like metal-dependent hydrolase (Beta-lactamase superfamily II) n=1 Tax=Sphingobium boeckii TaxID=1082345 RepID=A0A7W9EE07_9SPHN|nr:MBL fold metallo-hydrolase [Sphingobium boeckii]MBB5685788.1 glyoxylase-like metal-dependent hydrolase (beta-lactamase superfamily II) [Sphingobium boeckii]
MDISKNSDITPDASLTQDDSFVATSHKGLTYPLGAFAPAPGTLHRLADGVRWARIEMPGALAHINCWVLDDAGGVTICDTGLNLPECRGNWDAIFAGELADVPVTRIIGTHLHPDHIGLAGWLAHRFDAPVWMTRGEWLTIRMLWADARDAVPDDVIAFRRAAGWNGAQIAAGNEEGWSRIRDIITPLPMGYRRMQDGDVLDLGAHRWRVVTGSGHSPEHACLINEAAGVMIAGDQVLPRISSNVSLGVTEPEADPLGDWLASIEKLLLLPDDLLVLPAHGQPFRGLHARLKSLRDEHHASLDKLASFAVEPKRAVDCFGRLFRRAIDQSILGMATGEALAHLRHLEVTGRVGREVRDGVWWYKAH